MSAPEIDSYAIGSVQSSIETRQNNDGMIWYRGYVFTPHGIVVVVYSEPRWTRLDFVHNGRVYRGHWRRQYRPAYLVTLAKRFAAEVTGS